MKKILLTLSLILGYAYSYSQCTPDPIYQDSTYNIWPDTNINLPPIPLQGEPYETVLNIKTPTTLIEAAGGDSSFTQLDTTIFGVSYSFQLADWPVDSMSLVSIDGLPNGLSLNCSYSNCVLPGNVLTCATVSGNTNDPEGVYPVTIWVDVYTHGTLDLGLIQYPLSTSLFEATGSYESVNGYKIVIGPTSYEFINSHDFILLQNFPNPTRGITTIKFNTPSSDIVTLLITDMFGKVVLSEEFSSVVGVNELNLNLGLSSGIYNYSILYGSEILSKRLIISD